jgi:hypothetical protein
MERAQERCCNLLLVFLFISVLARAHINSSCVLYKEQTIEKKNIVNNDIECSTLWKQNKKYHLCFVDETIDWFHIKSTLGIGFFCCWILIGDDVFRRDVGLGEKVGRYSFNADRDNGGKSRTINFW